MCEKNRALSNASCGIQIRDRKHYAGLPRAFPGRLVPGRNIDLLCGQLPRKGDQYYVRVPDDRERLEEGQRSACGLRPGESSPRSIVVAIDLATWEARTWGLKVRGRDDKRTTLFGDVQTGQRDQEHGALLRRGRRPAAGGWHGVRG